MQNTGMLETHQAAPKEAPKDFAQQSDEEKALCKQLDKMFKKAAKHRRQYDCHWVDNYKMYRGNQWLQKRPSYKHKEVVNLIYQTIQSQTAVMLDVRPTLGFLPRDPSDLELAEIVQMVFQADWERGNWSDELMAVIYDAHLYSVGFSGLEYKKDLNKGFGGQEYSCEDPFDFYPDPDASDVNKKGEWFLKVKPETIDKLKKKYHDHKYVDQIKPDVEDLDYDRRSVETLHRAKNTNLDLPSETTSSLGSDKEDSDKAMVITAYLKPSDVEQVEENDEQTGEKLFITRKKYPRGRKVVKINNYIFEDTPLEDDHLEFPFSRCLNSVLPREFYGVSEIDNTKGPQMVFNKLINFSLDVLTLMGNPIWLVPLEGNVNTRKLNSSPGLIVEHAKDGKPERQEGLGLQPAVLQMIDRMEKWFNDEAGTQDVTRGVNPTGVTANAAIENLLDQAQKRIKQKMRNMDSYLKSMGRQWVSNVFQYYTAPQIFRLTNKEGVNKYFKFSIEERDVAGEDPTKPPTKEKFAIVRDYVQNEQNGPLQAANEQKEYQVRGDFDIIVNTISGLPFSEAQKQDKLIGLMNAGVIDAEEVLKGIDYPNYQAVLQRVQQQQQAAAQAQQQGA